MKDSAQSLIVFFNTSYMDNSIVCFVVGSLTTLPHLLNYVLIQDPIARSLHMCCTLERTLSSKELFLEQAFPRKYIFHDSDKFSHTLSAIVLKGSSEHTKKYV